MNAVLALALAFGSWLVPALVRAQNAERVVNQFTDFWARADAGSISALAARDGVSLNLDGQRVGPLAARQATALLRRLFEERETINVRMMGTQVVGGRPSRAIGEVSWMMRSRGTTIPEKTSVLITLVLEDDRWRITEIRFVR